MASLRGRQRETGAISVRQQHAGDDAFRWTRAGEVLDDRGEIQDEHDAAIAEDGGTADQIGGDGLVVERFDDELFFAIEAVDDESEFTLAHGNDEHEKFASATVGSSLWCTASP